MEQMPVPGVFVCGTRVAAGGGIYCMHGAEQVLRTFPSAPLASMAQPQRQGELCPSARDSDAAFSWGQMKLRRGRHGAAQGMCVSTLQDHKSGGYLIMELQNPQHASKGAAELAGAGVCSRLAVLPCPVGRMECESRHPGSRCTQRLICKAKPLP